VIKSIRKFFDDRGFQELLCPILHQSVPAEPTIYPFVTYWDRYFDDKIKTMPLYLPLSPERAMKHYLARGFGECYTIGHCCRNLEGAGPTHHPEFLMLEWYRRDADYQAIMADTAELLSHLAQVITGHTTFTWDGQTLDFASWPQLSLDSLWQQHLGVPIQEILDLSALSSLAAARGCNTAGATWEQLFNQLTLNFVEPHFPPTTFFLLDFPACLSPLCHPRADKPWLAERFEVYVGGVELGNGNSEHLDAARIRESFAAELTTRQRQHLQTPPLDEAMIADIQAMARSGHQFAGIGLGVDRVAMILTGQTSLGAWWPSFDLKNPQVVTHPDQ